MIALPEPGHKYVIGADPAEGNPTSDDSTLCVLDADSDWQAAELASFYQACAASQATSAAARSP
jgi:hypothetical protein